MKLAGREALRYLAAPEPARPGLLVWGADPVRVAAARAEAAAALTGEGAEAEMRLARLNGADLRKDPAALLDAMLARGFFPGPRAVVVDEATDALAPAIGAALKGWAAGDAVLVVAAGALTARSALRKLFESHPAAVSIALYDDPPGREELAALLARAGVEAGREAMADLLALARDLPPGDLRQLIDKLALYGRGSGPLTPADVAACAPPLREAEADDLLHAVAEGRLPEVGALFARMGGQGMAPVTLAIAALRHFRQLHAAAADPEGPAAGLARARPPVPFRARDRMQAQAQAWGLRGAEEAIRLLVETDLALRSSSRAPAMAVLERALLRLAGMRQRLR